MPVRWRLLAALPIINVITGVVVSGLNNDGADSLGDMGLDVVIAVAVAFTVSLELTVLRGQVGAAAGRRPAWPPPSGSRRGTSTRARS